jgi:hypothetical protein
MRVPLSLPPAEDEMDACSAIAMGLLDVSQVCVFCSRTNLPMNFLPWYSKTVNCQTIYAPSGTGMERMESILTATGKQHPFHRFRQHCRFLPFSASPTWEKKREVSSVA